MASALLRAFVDSFAPLRAHLLRLPIALLALARQPDQPGDQLALWQVPPEAPRHMLAQGVRVEPSRVEGVPVVGAPQFGAGVISMLGPLPPLLRTGASVVQRLAIVANAVARGGDQPALPAQPFGEVAAGAFEDVVSGFVEGHQVELELLSERRRQRHETQESMQVMRFAADLLDPPLQFAAQTITGQHGGTVAVGYPPEHFVQQAPALLAAIARGLFELGQQDGRYARAKRPGACR